MDVARAAAAQGGAGAVRHRQLHRARREASALGCLAKPYIASEALLGALDRELQGER